MLLATILCWRDSAEWASARAVANAPAEAIAEAAKRPPGAQLPSMPVAKSKFDAAATE